MDRTGVADHGSHEFAGLGRTQADHGIVARRGNPFAVRTVGDRPHIIGGVAGLDRPTLNAGIFAGLATAAVGQIGSPPWASSVLAGGDFASGFSVATGGASAGLSRTLAGSFFQAYLAENSSTLKVSCSPLGVIAT